MNLSSKFQEFFLRQQQKLKLLKMTLNLFLLIAMGLLAINSRAARVSIPNAQTVAFNFLKDINPGVTAVNTLTLTYTSVNSAGTTMFYVFQHLNGFVLIAADDRIDPILGYSNEGRPFPENRGNNFGNNFWGLMETYNKVITHVIENNLPGTLSITDKWVALKNGGKNAKSHGVVVNPLLTTTWDQGWPYNALCPGGSLTGCVATAMAQIMKFHNWPNQGLGAFSYDWCPGPCPGNTYSANFGQAIYNIASMPNACASVDSNVARLMYHCGVACGAQFGTGGTNVYYSSSSDPMTRAFLNYFRYASSTLQYVKSGDYATAVWDSLIQAELTSNRPVYYRGDGVGSHAWVCDGMNLSGLYHFNFGWGGSYNGYYALSAITPGGYNFTNNQHAIIGIKPNDGSTIVENTAWSGTLQFGSNVTIPNAITVTVNPGATVKFGQNSRLQVYGRLISIGSPQNMNRFTAIDTTFGWNGINWNNNWMNRMVMADNDTSMLVYTQAEYSKSYGIYCEAFGKVILSHCKINNNHGNWGAGISVWQIPIKISYCEIYTNHALIQGGGIYMTTTGTLSGLIDHNDIHGNLGDIDGGGFCLSATNNIVFERNNVHHNQAVKGAGGVITSTNMFLTNNKICNNNASVYGGGLYMENCNANIVDNVISNNNALSGGAFGIWNSSAPMILNNTISENYTQIVSSIVLTSNSLPTFKNTIMYGNYNGNGKEFYLGDNGCDPFIDHCDLQGGINSFGGPGGGSNYNTANYTNNIDTIPQFISPSAGAGTGYDGLNANWQLQSTSPCINAADITGVSSFLPSLDLAGNPRINGAIDMGAYEYTIPVPAQVLVNNVTLGNGNYACYNATQTIAVAGNGSLFKVHAGGSVEMIAGQMINYLPGATVEEGGYMHGYIAPTGPWCNAPALPLATTIGPEKNGMPAQTASDGFLVFPNPTTGEFTLSLAGHPATGMAKVSIFGLPGEKIFETTMEAGTSRVFSLAGRASGVYYTRVETGSETIKGKIVKL